MFKKEDIVRINKRFASGNMVNEGSLEFALSSIKKKGWPDQAAYLLRALLLDHVFEDGNKRTAAAIIAAYYTEFEIGFDAQKIAEAVIKIASKNIDEITKIKKMMKDVVR